MVRGGVTTRRHTRRHLLPFVHTHTHARPKRGNFKKMNPRNVLKVAHTFGRFPRSVLRLTGCAVEPNLNGLIAGSINSSQNLETRP